MNNLTEREAPHAMRFFIVDAFTDRVFRGNPAAVVPLERFLPDPVMQAIAAEHNLSETAFVVPDGADWRLRWFTPTVEVDLCGHATLATGFVLDRLGAPPPWRFHTRSGLLTASPAEHRIVLDFPARDCAVPEAPPPSLVEALGATPAEVYRALDWICVFADPAAVAALRPDPERLARVAPGAAIVTALGGPADAPGDISSRYFAPAYGIAEDPVTGSAHTQLVPFWARRLGRTRLLCRQLSARGGTLFCEWAGERVRIAGETVLYASGEFYLPR